MPPLWTCPKCGAKFVSANMWHSCGRYRLEDLFARSEPHVFQLFQQFSAMVRSCGLVKMIPQKSRIVFMVRMRFVNIGVRKQGLLIGFILTRRIEHPALEKTEVYAPKCIGAYLRIERAGQLDRSVQRLIREAYDSGTQKDFVRRGKSARRRTTS